MGCLEIISGRCKCLGGSPRVVACVNRDCDYLHVCIRFCTLARFVMDRIYQNGICSRCTNVRGRIMNPSSTPKSLHKQGTNVCSLCLFVCCRNLHTYTFYKEVSVSFSLSLPLSFILSPITPSSVVDPHFLPTLLILLPIILFSI